MEELLEDYKRRLKSALELLSHTKGISRIRITTKCSCYRAFISELEREIFNKE